MSKPRILFLTSPEHGQANVHLAVISSLLERYEGQVELHLATFESFRARVPAGVKYHSVIGKGIKELWHLKDKTGFAEQSKYTKPGFFGALSAVTKMMITLHPEPAIDYVATAKDVICILEEVQPVYVVVDPLFNAGRDALDKSGLPRAILSPVTVKEDAQAQQGLAVFGWPSVGTGYPYPLPWYLYPMNAINLIWTALWLLVFDSTGRTLNRARHNTGFTNPLPVFDQSRNDLKFCMSWPEADILAVIPDWLICCGPILQASKPVSMADPDLYAWLLTRPTVIVVLGSHVVMNDKQAGEMLASFRVLLDERKDIQILWKLQKLGEYDLESVEDLGDRLKIVDWFECDPLAIMQTGNVICSINHGGSNSYHEALLTGTPQVILPPWYDCYDGATRCEYLGIGKWGSKTAAPFCSEPELTEALLAVVGATPDAPEAVKIRKRAKELSDIVTDGGKRIGRDVAADRIWQEVQTVLKKSI